MSKYRQTKSEFFHKGHDAGQKSPDLVMDIKRVSEEKIKKWPQDAKEAAIKWLERNEAVFMAYKSEILKGLSHEQQ